MLVDTLKQAFLGNKAPFARLYLENVWDWSLQYPVIHLDFGNGVVQSTTGLNVKINSLLDWYYDNYQIANKYDEVGDRFSYLISELAKKYQQKVVILSMNTTSRF